MTVVASSRQRPAPAPPDAATAPPPRYIGVVTRAIAFAADAAIVNGVAIAVIAVVALTVSIVDVPDGVDTAIVAVGGAVYVLWTVGYFAAFWSTTGQTPGDRLLRIRVVAANGGTLPVRRAVLRFVALMLAAIPLFAGFWPILVDPRRRGLHDLVARTVVVDDEPVPPPPAPPAPPAPPRWSAPGSRP